MCRDSKHYPSSGHTKEQHASLLLARTSPIASCSLLFYCVCCHCVALQCVVGCDWFDKYGMQAGRPHWGVRAIDFDWGVFDGFTRCHILYRPISFSQNKHGRRKKRNEHTYKLSISIGKACEKTDFLHKNNLFQQQGR